jgi:hypothetical protein
MNRTFLLGMGAHKAGTTWLHSVLAALPEANFGDLKEYHVLDAVHVPEYRNFQVDGRKVVSSWLRTLRGDPLGAAMRIRRRLQRDPEAYFDYFAGLLQGRTGLTGDITPTYASLSPEVLHQVRDGFARRGVTVKTVFLMRDPVERTWSAVRHNRRNKARRSEALPLSEEADLQMSFDQPRTRLRASYDLTAANIRQVFPPEDSHFGLYETLFTAAEIDRLSAFLGCEITDPDFGKRVNVSPKGAPISPDLAVAIAREYRASYDFARQEFGTDLIDRLWPSAALLGDPPAPAAGTGA